jgi:hypothetical protein
VALGRILPMLEPWHDPGYVKRAWCLFELYTAIQKRSEVEIDIILSPNEAQSFHDRINRDGTDAHAIDDALAHVRSEDAEASVQADLDAIRVLIQKYSGGFGTLNDTVKQYLRRWFESQGGIKVVARAGHRNSASRSRSTEQSRPSGTAQANSGGQAASTPPHVAAVDVGPAPGDDGLTGVELPDATDDGDEYLDENGAAFGFGFTVLPHVNGSSDGSLDVSPEAASGTDATRDARKREMHMTAPLSTSPESTPSGALAEQSVQEFGFGLATDLEGSNVERLDVQEHGSAGATPGGKLCMSFGFSTGNASAAAAGPGHIKPGDRVSVNGHDGAGTVRFVGNHHVHGEARIGVELDAATGKNNGTIKGFHYFDCASGHGLLVKPGRVQHVREFQPTTTEIPGGHGLEFGGFEEPHTEAEQV